MDRFSKFHPAVCFSYFICAITAVLIFVNPVYSPAALVSAFLYYFRLKGRAAFFLLLKFVLPLIALTAVFNVLFCSYGGTVLFSLGSKDFTLEPLVYGACTGIMLGAVMLYFLAYSEVVTSEKIMALFGGLMPNLTLLLSMVLRFIPHMIKISEEIREAQKGISAETKGIKNALRRFSALTSICLEESIETADTMKARGFGKGKRAGYSRFGFACSDAFAAAAAAVLFCITAYSAAVNACTFEYYSEIKLELNRFYFSVFLLLMLLPAIIDFMEDIKWLQLKSKI